MAEDLRRLLARLAVCVGLAALAILAGPVVHLRFDPGGALLVGAVIGVGWWLTEHLPGGWEPPLWSPPEWRSPAPSLVADQRTRKLASMIAHAQPGQAFDARRLAATLDDIVVRRLASPGRGPLGDLPPDVATRLSPALLGYLRSARDGKPQPLNRRTLRAHLKEIDSL